MSKDAPHLIVLTIFGAWAHYTQLGTELAKRTALEGSLPGLETASNAAILVALSLAAVRLLPWLCRFVLATYDVLGRTEARALKGARIRLVRLVEGVLVRLQDSPLASGKSGAARQGDCTTNDTSPASTMQPPDD